MRAFLIGLTCGSLLASLALAGSAPPAASPRRQIHLRFGTFDPLEGPLSLPERHRLEHEPGRGYFLVQLEGTPDRSARARLRARGAEPLAYIPDGTYIVRLSEGRAASVRAMPGVRWLGAVEPGFKLSPDLGRRSFVDGTRRAEGQAYATVDLFRGEDLAAATRRIAATGAQVLQAASFSDTLRVKVRATTGQLESASRIPAVAWIEEALEATPRNNTATWVVQTDSPGSTTVWGHGLHGEQQIIGIIDWPIDMNSCFFSDPLNNTPGPGHRKVVAYRSTAGLGAHYHGTHVAGIAAGNSFPVNSSLDSAGHAYQAKISYGSVVDITGSGSNPSNLYAALSSAHTDGARVHSNSWGDDGTTAYASWSRDADLFSYDFEESLVLFSVTNLSTLRSPENAKNVVAVAGTGNGPAEDSWCRGGTGPTSDGRRKPDLMAPGCDISSARDSFSCATRLLNGTSMASPAVAGAATLARQYFVEGWYPTGTPQTADARVPSGALLKALLVNSSRNLGGVLGFPGNQEGWGRVLLEDALYFSGDARRLLVLGDVRNASGLGTGDHDAFLVRVDSVAEPLEITLAFTEPPAALLAAAATVNDLDLEAISPSGLLYRGNALDSILEQSVPVGQADPRNNVEAVLLGSPEIGTWLVTVRGTAVNEGAQGYALVATGDIQAGSSSGIVRHAGHRVDDNGTFADGDGTPEPGETVLVPLSLLNFRGTTAMNLSASLYSGDPALASVTAGAAPYVDLPSNEVGESLVPHFELAISPLAVCGDPIPLTVRASYTGGTNDSPFQFVVGDPSSGGDDACVPLECAGDPLPGDVGPTLMLPASPGADVLLQWTEVPGASSYRVYRSSTRNFSTASLVGSVPGPSFLDVGARLLGTACYYRVRAVNSCGWEGP